VPFFGPKLPSPAIFSKGKKLKEFLLAKLINGERACYKATKFYALHQRTRASLLENVTHELRMRTEDYVATAGVSATKMAPASTKLISKLTRKALLGNTKSKGQPQLPAPVSSCGSVTGSSAKPLRKYSSHGLLSVSSGSSGGGNNDKSAAAAADNGSISTLTSNNSSRFGAAVWPYIWVEIWDFYTNVFV
jgi:hypothetical protein